MRTYGQFCALAKALDVVGDRWTLLIVRELMLWKRARYTELKSGLPGIASNLLSERLRELEEAGILTREDAPPPVAATLYALTERGRSLAPAIRALGRWGAPLLAQAPKTDEVRGHWVGLPVELYMTDAKPTAPPMTLQVRTADYPVTLRIGNGEIESEIGTAARPDATISGPAREVLRVLLKRTTLAKAKASGVTYRGDRSVLARLKPAA